MHPDLRRRIGNRIREERQKLDISPSELARRLNTEYRIIRRYEEGETLPRIERLEEIARALNIPLYELFRFETGRRADIEAVGHLLDRMSVTAPDLPRRVLKALRALFPER